MKKNNIKASKEDENLDSGIKTHEEDTQDTKNDIQNNETENKPDNDIKNSTPNQEKIKDEKQEKSKENIKENPKFYETKNRKQKLQSIQIPTLQILIQTIRKI